MEYQKPYPEQTQPKRGWPMLAWILGAGLVLAAGLVVLLVALSPASRVVNNFLVWAFAVDRVQVMWYITRAAGLLAYVLLWLSTAWGLAVSSKILDPLLHRAFTYDFHQFISLLGIGFLFLHLGVLLFDRYLPYSIAQVLVPFLSPYRPLWVGVGGIAFLPHPARHGYLLPAPSHRHAGLPRHPRLQPGGIPGVRCPRLFRRNRFACWRQPSSCMPAHCWWSSS